MDNGGVAAGVVNVEVARERLMAQLELNEKIHCRGRPLYVRN